MGKSMAVFIFLAASAWAEAVPADPLAGELIQGQCLSSGLVRSLFVEYLQRNLFESLKGVSVELTPTAA